MVSRYLPSLLLVVCVCAQSCRIGSAVGRGGEACERPCVEVGEFGRYRDGRVVELFTLRNGNGVEARVMTHGATLVTVKAPDRDGKVDVITLHKDSYEEYVRGHPFLGSTIGRFANRIAGARFEIDGVEYELERASHGGGPESGFQHLLWKGEAIEGADWAGARLTLHSPDGQGGFPGALDATVTFSLNNRNELTIDYRATTDKPTHVNLTNHAYWNLAGSDSGKDVLGHILTLNADRRLVVDEKVFPTGEIVDVKGTPFDFTTPHAIGERIDQVFKQRYDHCFIRQTDPTKKMTRLARVEEPTTGRVLEVFATQPGVQFYTGNPGGFCLETQHFPDAPNQPHFPSTLLRPGELYEQTAVFRLSTASNGR